MHRLYNIDDLMELVTIIFFIKMQMKETHRK